MCICQRLCHKCQRRTINRSVSALSDQTDGILVIPRYCNRTMTRNYIDFLASTMIIFRYHTRSSKLPVVPNSFRRGEPSRSFVSRVFFRLTSLRARFHFGRRSDENRGSMVVEVRNATLRRCFNTVHWFSTMRAFHGSDRQGCGLFMDRILLI